MTDDEQDPLERLFTAEEEDRPEEVAVPEDALSIDAEVFFEQLEALADAAEAIVLLQEDLAALRTTGLDEQDARDLIYGRNSRLTKSDIDDIFGAIDDVDPDSTIRGSALLVRVLSDVSGQNLGDTEQVVAELNRLRTKYADRGEADE